MDNSAEAAARTEMRHPLTKWVDEMQDVLRTVTALMEDNERLQTVAESAQREHADLQEQLTRARTDLQDQLSHARADLQQQRGLAESTQREVEQLRAEVAALQGENERLKTEQTEAGESAAKLLGEMKDLVNQVAHKFQGPSKSSPFARDPRAPQA